MKEKRIVAIAHCSEGNAVCGNNWTEAKTFEKGEWLRSVMEWFGEVRGARQLELRMESE